MKRDYKVGDKVFVNRNEYFGRSAAKVTSASDDGVTIKSLDVRGVTGFFYFKDVRPYTVERDNQLKGYKALLAQVNKMKRKLFKD